MIVTMINFQAFTCMYLWLLLCKTIIRNIPNECKACLHIKRPK